MAATANSSVGSGKSSVSAGKTTPSVIPSPSALNALQSFLTSSVENHRRSTESLIASLEKLVGDGGASKGKTSEATVLEDKCLSHFQAMKYHQRSGRRAVDAAEKAAEGARGQVEDMGMVLQNLLYEKAHLLREIRRNRDFRTRQLE
eukprot:CAMPEP_0113323858 /NCGR_PEP_ID=MMETSP0010_2-20120614/16624_1 /TAXON_ID=216773 ORGANISM="Corethron hystrix, Strain 308" /NCGR_SAMPLE_ID=MMETSP0010_2 /ASSEMBLY_ACC=CAM_ASM_000155 /LENGTH=146 /DNA_ID=CAMNT_0000182975 /DNA_START=13 /DNA_END=450 /DNA_ORIENTATION=+ /assembly_acc=CAM_ASM_000155